MFDYIAMIVGYGVIAIIIFSIWVLMVTMLAKILYHGFYFYRLWLRALKVHRPSTPLWYKIYGLFCIFVLDWKSWAFWKQGNTVRSSSELIYEGGRNGVVKGTGAVKVTNNSNEK